MTLKDKTVRDRDASLTNAGRQTIYGSPSFSMFNTSLNFLCGLSVAEGNMQENSFHFFKTTFKQNIDELVRRVADRVVIN